MDKWSLRSMKGDNNKCKKLKLPSFCKIKFRTASVTLMNNENSSSTKENQTIVGETSVPIKKGKKKKSI